MGILIFLALGYMVYYYGSRSGFFDWLILPVKILFVGWILLIVLLVLTE